MSSHADPHSRSPRRHAALALAAGLTAAGAGFAIAASASHADCPPQAHTCGTTHTGTTPGASAGGQSGDHRQADPRDGILPISAQARPILGQRVTLDGASGNVLVRAPHSARFVALGPGASVPVGSTVDTTHGAVTLTSVKDASGTVQHGRFWGGRFKVEQSSGTHPVTVLVLTGSVGVCPSRHDRTAVSSSRRRSSRLWGHDRHGSFATRGYYGVASVRGTVWLSQNSCSATLFRVTRGAIVVQDFRRHRKVRVTAGRSYVAQR